MHSINSNWCIKIKYRIAYGQFCPSGIYSTKKKCLIWSTYPRRSCQKILKQFSENIDESRWDDRGFLERSWPRVQRTHKT